MRSASVTEPAEELSDGNHADENEPDDEHGEHDVLAFLGDVGGEKGGELNHRLRTLTHAPQVRRQRAVHRVVACLAPGERE